MNSLKRLLIMTSLFVGLHANEVVDKNDTIQEVTELGTTFTKLTKDLIRSRRKSDELLISLTMGLASLIDTNIKTNKRLCKVEAKIVTVDAVLTNHSDRIAELERRLDK